MSDPRVVVLQSRPERASQLCFDTSGILATLDTAVGKPVAAFDFAAFQAVLGGTPTIPGHPSRLLYDFLDIEAVVKDARLASLRAEPAKANLHKAIGARQNTFYTKHANAPEVIKTLQELYSPASVKSKNYALQVLDAIATTQFSLLIDAYNQDGRVGVVRTTSSEIQSSTVSHEATKQHILTVGQADAITDEKGTVDATGSGAQRITSTDYGYRVPFYETFAQYLRANISLIDQRADQLMASQTIPYLPYIFANELNALDAEVFKLQIALLGTYLMSPFKGTVAEVYKAPGDPIRAGEPVLRVEDNSTVVLSGAIIYRDRIVPGRKLELTTPLFDPSGAPVRLEATVTTARGPYAGETWEITARMANVDGAGQEILPPSYTFRPDGTAAALA